MSEDILSVNLELSHSENKNGLYTIYMRMTHNRKHNRINTGILVKENQFNRKANFGQWVSKHSDASSYNEVLIKKIREARNAWNEKRLSNEYVNLDIVTASIKNGNASKDFFLFWDKKVEQMHNYNQSKGYNTTKNKHLVPFFKKLGYSDVDFRQVTPSVLMDIENYLRKKGLETASIYSQLKRVRAIFNKAIAESVIDPSIYPFKGYKMPKVISNGKERLNEEEVHRFAAVLLKSGSVAFNTQQAWMLSFYCAGIRVEDLLTLKVKNVVHGRLVYQMNKTGALKSIKVTSKIQAILDHFITKNSKPNDYIFPFMPADADGMEQEGKEFKGLVSSKTALMNKYLKEIAEKARIDKKITNHIARHSFANVARKKTKDIHAIKSALGHSSVKITEMYLDSFDEDGLDEMMEKVMG